MRKDEAFPLAQPCRLLASLRGDALSPATPSESQAPADLKQTVLRGFHQGTEHVHPSLHQPRDTQRENTAELKGLWHCEKPDCSAQAAPKVLEKGACLGR